MREVHGHMVGPDEADLIESDDSDKVRRGLIAIAVAKLMLQVAKHSAYHRART